MTGYKDYWWDESATDAHAYLYPSLRSMLEHDKSKRILDLVGGNGTIACRLLDEGFDLYGVDTSESGIRIANGRYPGRFFRSGYCKESLPDELAHPDFDLVISTEVIEHLYAPRGYMSFIRDVLGKRAAI